MEQFVKAHASDVLALTKALCAIPAPVGAEQARAAFVTEWLRDHGFVPQTDAVGNVVFSTGENWNTLLMAHLDTVFPPETPLAWVETGDRIVCPSIGDDTVHVAMLLYTALYAKEKGIPLLFAANVGEEGGGNLRGCRELMKTYAKSLHAVISFDSYLDKINTVAVGSERYRITCDTAGGHSYRDFGKPNAIAILGNLIAELDAQTVFPEATYNFGLISGGTSVNAIAAHAEMSYEFRSNNADSLDGMRAQMQAILKKYPVKAETVGIRPCGRVDERKQERLALLCESCFAGLPAPERQPGSTDCNLPLSIGIPAVCVGLVYGGGAHTTAEYILPRSIPSGLLVALRLAEKL